MPSIIYAAMKSLIKKRDGCANNPENSSTIKIGEHVLCRYSISTNLITQKTNILYIVEKIV